MCLTSKYFNLFNNKILFGRKSLFTLLFIFFTINCHAQNMDKFRVDYDLFTFYNPKTKTWSEWEEIDNTFVININQNGDIAHFKANGEIATYKKLSSVVNGYTNDKKHFQIIKALDDTGNIFRFQFFDDREIGLKMRWGEFMIQFAKKSNVFNSWILITII